RQRRVSASAPVELRRVVREHRRSRTPDMRDQSTELDLCERPTRTSFEFSSHAVSIDRALLRGSEILPITGAAVLRVDHAQLLRQRRQLRSPTVITEHVGDSVTEGVVETLVDGALKVADDLRGIRLIARDQLCVR